MAISSRSFCSLCALFVFFLSLVGSVSISWGDTESSRYLRNGIHFFEMGQYEKSRGYFIALFSIGTPQEVATARRYLRKPELRAARNRQRASHAESPTERARIFLRKGIALYDADDYQGAFNYFNAVLGLGTEQQKGIASSYLSKPELHDFVVTEAAPRETEPSVPSEESSTRLSGSIREEVAARTHSPAQWSKLRTVGSLALTGQFSEALSYKASGRLWYNGIFDATAHYLRSVEDDEKTDGQVRDTYFDFSRGNFDARLGKQQIVWGEALALFYADTVNAKDLREFVLPEFDFVRIPEWSTDLEYIVGDGHAEFIWIPIPEMDKVGRPGSEYAFVSPTPSNLQTVYGPEEAPTRSLENSEVGGRLSYRMHGWDVSAFHLRTWDKFPVYTTAFPTPDTVLLTATHPRLTVDGFTVAKEAHEIVWKGELVYNWQKFFQTLDPAVPQGIIAKDYTDYLVSADHRFGEGPQVSFQISQRWIRNYESNLFMQKRFQSSIALWLRQDFLNNRLEPELLIVQNVTMGDRMVRPKVTYKFASHWRISSGVDLFSGHDDTLFGEFSNRQRVYTDLQYDF